MIRGVRDSKQENIGKGDVEGQTHKEAEENRCTGIEVARRTAACDLCGVSRMERRPEDINEVVNRVGHVESIAAMLETPLFVDPLLTKPISSIGERSNAEG